MILIPDNIKEQWEIEFDSNKGYLKFTLKNFEFQEEVPRAQQQQPQGTQSNSDPSSNLLDHKTFNIYEKKPRKFETKLVKPSFSQDKLALYRRYNAVVHNKPPIREGYFRTFICSNHIINEEIQSTTDSIESYTVGNFHLELYLDDKLFGVINQEYLKSGLTSCYFFFDPIFKPLSMGIVATLMEIQTIKDMSVNYPNFKYYYMSTYIHNYSKYGYKINYRPVDFWCPVGKMWVELDDKVMQKLEKDEAQLCDERDPEVDEKEYAEDLLGFLAELESSRKLFLFDLPAMADHYGSETIEFEGTVLKLFNGFHDESIGPWLRAFSLKFYDLYDALGKENVSRIDFILNQ
jgi:arginyl-tRNA--protein-N-Asp/Glu arginylyltransferase